MIRHFGYIPESINVQIRADLMDPNINSIWFEMGLRNKKKILINQVYREWQQLGASETVSIPKQLVRWGQYLTMWEKALDTGMEVLCMGDFNLSHCN